MLTENGRTGLPPFQEVQLSLSGPDKMALPTLPRHTVPQTRQKALTCPCPAEPFKYDSAFENVDHYF